MKIGFTGSSRGLTKPQQEALRGLLFSWFEEGITEAHHGDCEGGDVAFHDLCLGLEVPVVGHPPTNPKLRAFCLRFASKWPPKPYLDRNRDIVVCSDRLISCPGTMIEIQRSGTWSTTRYARKTNTPTWLIRPDGSVEPSVTPAEGDLHLHTDQDSGEVFLPDEWFTFKEEGSDAPER